MLSNLRTNQKTYEAENRQKIKNSQSQFKIYWFLSKKSEYIVHILLYCRLQSRSQDFARRRRGFFGSLMQPKTNLTQIFISLKLDWGVFFVKIRWSPKKKRKKRSSPKFKGFFRPKSETQSFFSADCRWSQIKKRSLPKFKRFFRPKLQIQKFFSGRN